MKITFHNKLQRYYGSTAYTFGLGFGLTKAGLVQGATKRTKISMYSFEFIFGPFVMNISWGNVE